jgi:type I restriction enzyme R subunit
VKNPPRATKLKTDQIKDLIHRNFESEETIDVYAIAGIEKPDISILNEDFLLAPKSRSQGWTSKLSSCGKS